MKNIKFISLIGLAGMMLTSLSGCSSETDSNTLYLKVLKIKIMDMKKLI